VVAGTFASLDTLREAAKEDSEPRKTVNDCEALAWLGCYYATRIRGACALAADLNIARNWKPGTLKDDGKRAGSEKGFRK